MLIQILGYGTIKDLLNNLRLSLTEDAFLSAFSEEIRIILQYPKPWYLFPPQLLLELQVNHFHFSICWGNKHGSLSRSCSIYWDSLSDLFCSPRDHSHFALFHPFFWLHIHYAHTFHVFLLDVWVFQISVICTSVERRWKKHGGVVQLKSYINLMLEM